MLQFHDITADFSRGCHWVHRKWRWEEFDIVLSKLLSRDTSADGKHRPSLVELCKGILVDPLQVEATWSNWMVEHLENLPVLFEEENGSASGRLRASME